MTSLQHRPAGKRMKHFHEPGAHARTHPGSQDDRGSRFHLVIPFLSVVVDIVPSRSYQIAGEENRIEPRLKTREAQKSIPAYGGGDARRRRWLGRQDSNLDNEIQNLGSYR